jgi:Ca2+-transporting ATPase
VPAALIVDEIVADAELVRHGAFSRRVRLRAPSLRGADHGLRAALARRLGAWPGVRDLQIDGRSGSVLLLTDGDALPPPLAQALARARKQPRERSLRALPGGGRAPAPVPDCHSLAVSDVIARLHTTPSGLTTAQAQQRARRVGPNLLERDRPRSRLRLWAAQLGNVQSALLLGASALSTALGELVDAGAIATVLALDAAIGYRVERGSERLLASWRRAEAGEVRVLRDQRVHERSTAELVPGDVALVRAGDVVPADARVLEAHRLQCDEAPLTGESEPQTKRPHAVAQTAPLAEHTSMVYAGTTVVAGRGRVLVTATGSATELARVRRLIAESAAPETPLARRLNRLSHRVAGASMGAAALAALAGLWHRRPLAQVARGAVALGLAALPEGLPVVSTAALVRSMARMRADGMLVRRLSSAETLGGVTVICTDKTGTLTRNQMQLDLVDADEELQATALRARPEALFADRVTFLLAAALLNSDVDVHRRGHELLSISGSSTEQALVLAAEAAGLSGWELRQRFPTRRLRERSEGQHFVVSLHDTPEGRTLALIKGAPEQVLERCDRVWRRPLDDSERARLRARSVGLARRGLRVLAVAWRRADGDRLPEDGYEWLGMVGLHDPLRPGARAAVRDAARAGIRTVIVTGDHRATAAAIARQLGLSGDALDGAELQALVRDGSPAARERLRRLAVVSRVSPADKLALVQALRAAGEVVAMAGDGINDAPALKVADVGVAVGRSASDLARHVADVVLASEDLHSILEAVAEGRVVQDNLRRAVHFLFATNLSELLLVLGAAIAGARDPLTPLQLLWINLLTDTLPALALALEPGDRDVLARPPASPSAPILSAALKRRVGRDGALMAALGGAAALGGGSPLAFGALSGAQLAYTLACRAPGATATPRFAALVGGTAALQLVALTLAPARRLLGLGAVSPTLPLGGFVAGFALPWLAGRLAADELVVAGRAAATQTVPATAWEPQRRLA